MKVTKIFLFKGQNMSVSCGMWTGLTFQHDVKAIYKLATMY